MRKHIKNPNKEAPQTNFDWIRGLSKDEFAREIGFMAAKMVFSSEDFKAFVYVRDHCIKTVKEWLSKDRTQNEEDQLQK